MATKMLKKLEIIGEHDEVFVIRTSNVTTGKVSASETYEGVKPMKEQEVGQILATDYKNQGNRRLAWLSMLSVVMANPRLDAYKGKGDVEHGKTSPEFRNAVRESENEYLRKLVKDGAVKLVVPKDGNPDQVFQTFATETREDKNYSNVKSTVMKYFAFVGASPATKSGYLVPVPVMAMEVQNILDAKKEPADNSLAGQIRAIQADLDKQTAPDLEDFSKAVPEIQRLLATIVGVLDHAAELATHAHSQATDIVQATKDALEGAGKKLVAPAPSGKGTKAKETA